MSCFQFILRKFCFTYCIFCTQLNVYLCLAVNHVAWISTFHQKQGQASVNCFHTIMSLRSALNLLSSCVLMILMKGNTKNRQSMTACSLLRMCCYSVVNCPGAETRTLETRSLKNLKPRSFKSCAHKNIT